MTSAGAQVADTVTSQRRFYAASILLFASAAALTIRWHGSMSIIGGMPMPGGWAMSMTWMRMPGQTWPGAAATFLGMWMVMMMAMMMPSLTAMLRRYRQAVGATGAIQLDGLTAVAAAGYFFVWLGVGLAVFLLGIAAAAVVMRLALLARAVPAAVGVVVLMCGAFQFTTWKAQHLRCCREAPRRDERLTADARTAWRQGIGLGWHCSCSSAGLTATLVVFGLMDLRAMGVVTAAIALERFTPSADRAVRAVGAAVIVVGTGLILRAAWQG